MKYTKYGWLCIVFLMYAVGLIAQETLVAKLDLWQPDIIQSPDNPDEWNAFRQELHHWRNETRKQVLYKDDLYNNSDFKSMASAYNCYFLMMYDEAFYDYRNNTYKVDEFLDGLLADYGRIDIVVLWHAYPRIGLDDRNQFDFYRDMPGGLEQIKKICDRLHERGIKVFINYNPWDTGTRREGISDVEALTAIVATIGADGIFLDTLPLGSSAFRDQLDAVRKGVVLESELSLPVEGIHDHHLSWAQWFADSHVPGVLRNKWFERRHIQHQISRWNRNKMKDIQTAWMNGSGMMIWENVFGQSIPWCKRDKWMLKMMSFIQNRYTDLFSDGEWLPLYGSIADTDVYSSLWQADGIRLWTLVNRSQQEKSGQLTTIDVKKNERYFDLVRGIEITVADKKNNKGTLEGAIAPQGLGCFLALEEKLVSDDFLNFLSSQAAVYKEESTDSHCPVLPTSLVTARTTKIYALPPRGMVKIPAVNDSLDVTFRVREIGYYESLDSSFMDVVYPALHHSTTKSKPINLKSYAMDKTPVTNIEFKKFVDETNYSPAIATNFLKHWIDGQIPSDEEDRPVVYIDLNDARAYAKWAGKRLPTEHEWQFAAQGTSKLKYPWGNEFDSGKCNAGALGRTTSVTQYPEGKSPFGCYDMCGNVWELTESEYSDGHTRFCILKGGSYYKPEGSDWYFDGGAQPVDFAAKQMLIYPGIDRCSTIGFRCVADLN